VEKIGGHMDCREAPAFFVRRFIRRIYLAILQVAIRWWPDYYRQNNPAKAIDN
jgi:hypothetical protein